MSVVKRNLIRHPSSPYCLHKISPRTFHGPYRLVRNDNGVLRKRNTYLQYFCIASAAAFEPNDAALLKSVQAPVLSVLTLANPRFK
jgi:hypothetical protein